MHSITHHNVDGLLEGDLILSPAGRWETVTEIFTFTNYPFLREVCTTWGPRTKPARWRVSVTTSFAISRGPIGATVALFDFSITNSGFLTVGIDTPDREHLYNPVVTIATATATHGDGWTVTDTYNPEPGGDPVTTFEGLTKAKARTQLKALGRTFAKTHDLTHDLTTIRTR